MISFIIPTLNEAKDIEKTLRMLQTYNGPHEIIVSDGKSDDDTVAIARSYTDHVIVAADRSKQSIAINRNAGAARATGEFLVFVDADMEIPNANAFFARALAYFEDPKLVGLCPQVRVHPEGETFADRIVMMFINWCIMYPQNNILGRGAASGEFQMVRRTAFEKVGGYNERLVVAEDVDFFVRLSKCGRTRFAGELLVYNNGRRPHKLGWPRLLYLWSINILWVTLFHKSAQTEWEPIR